MQLGLRDRAFEAGDLDATVEAEVKPFLSAAPGAVASAKALALELGGSVTEAQIDATISALVSRWESNEAREGIAAFFEKRAPDWAGDT